MLGSKIEACKLPRNDIKVTIVIEMTNFYDARGLFWSISKTPEHDQFLDPKCFGPDLYGEMACAKFSGIVSQASERPKTFRFFRGLHLLPVRSLKKKLSTNGQGGRGGNIQKLESRGPIFTNFWPFEPSF